MIDQKYQDIVSHIDYLISELHHLKSKITLEDGIHLNLISEDNLFIIEQWDSDLLEPRILSYFLKTTPEFIEKEIMKAIDITTMSPRTYKRNIYWNSDIPWDTIPENYRKLDGIYKIEKRELNKSLRETVKERVNALYNK